MHTWVPLKAPVIRDTHAQHYKKKNTTPIVRVIVMKKKSVLSTYMNLEILDIKMRK